MKDKIITISREYGSGGAEIGRQLAKKLGIPCYDREIVEKATVESGLLKADVEQKGEYLSALSKLTSHFTLYNLYSNMTKDDIIWHAQSKVIKQFADKGPCVIIGRCADYILRDYEDVVNIFIYSDMDKRIKRVAELHPDCKPEKYIKDIDKKRSMYYEHFTDMTWGDPRHYDICLNSGSLGADRCIDILTGIELD